MKVIGLVGRIGSGKHEVVRYLRERHDVPIYSIGDVVREIARARGVRPTRANLHILSEDILAEAGDAALADAVIDRMERSGARAVVVLGIRTPADERRFRSHFGRQFVLVHVDGAGLGDRLERLRKTGHTDEYDTYEQFRRAELEEEEWFHLDETVKRADITLKNYGTLSELHAAIERKIVQPYLVETAEH